MKTRYRSIQDRIAVAFTLLFLIGAVLLTVLLYTSATAMTYTPAPAWPTPRPAACTARRWTCNASNRPRSIMR